MNTKFRKPEIDFFIKSMQNLSRVESKMTNAELRDHIYVLAANFYRRVNGVDFPQDVYEPAIHSQYWD